MRGGFSRRVAVGIEHADDAARRTAKPPLGNTRTPRSVRAASRGRCRATGTARLACRAAPRLTQAAAPAGTHPLLQRAAAAVVRLEKRGAQRQRVRRLAARRCAAPTRRDPAARQWRARRARTRREAVLERGGEEQRLERRAGLTPAAARAIELRLREVAAADHRQDVARRGSIATSAACRSGALNRREAVATARSAASCSSGTNVVRTSQSGGWSPPNDRGTAAAGTPWRTRPRGSRRGVGTDRGCASGAPPLLRLGDEALLAHPRQHDVAASDGAVEVRPGESVDGARAARRSGRSRQASAVRGPAEQMRATSFRRRKRRRSGRCDSGRARAPDPSRAGRRSSAPDRLVELASVTIFRFDRNSVRASCCVRVLPPSTVPGDADVADDGPAERDRVDAGMLIEAMVLDGDERVLKIAGMSASGTSLRCSSIRNQRLPSAARNQVSPTPRGQPVDGIPLPQRPRDRARRRRRGGRRMTAASAIAQRARSHATRRARRARG